MRKVYFILIALHIFVGIGALAGGLAAIMDPIHPLGVSVELLEHSPFDSFLIPGIILFTVIGLGNIQSAFMFHFRLNYQGYISSFFGWALVVWIVVQCIMLRSVVFLHVLYFLIGLIQASLAMAVLYEQQLFPANIFRRLKKGK
jgi:hypothetical protein